MTLKWRGKELKAKIRRAQIQGVNETMAACVVHAKQNHPWQNQTGILEGSIDIAEYAKPVAGGVRGTWGSLDVLYAIYQELGTRFMSANPFLRPAADFHYPSLAGRIERAMR